MTIPIKTFLNLLVAQKALTQKEADHCEIEALQKNIPIDEYLIKNFPAKKEAVLKIKAGFLNIPWVNVESIPITPQLLSYIPESIARKNIILPLEFNPQNQSLKVVMENPFDLTVIEFLEKKTGKKIMPVLGLKNDIEKAIDAFYTQAFSPDVSAALKEVTPISLQKRTDENQSTEKTAPIAKIITTILEYALKGRASDVHIEPQEKSTRVRFRIDGLLNEKLSLPKEIHDSLVSRIKILSGLKIDEKRVPQDGRFNFKTAKEEVDLRISTLPSVHGEKVVMRLLRKTGGVPHLFDLGLRGPQLKLLEDAISKPYGIILVTGPTGSGKSTTLYSVLSRLNSSTVNIVTIEDPVEYQLTGINQVQINPQAGLTFATAMRAFLRQDPNIILVGEIRDQETTQLAIQAALTGHLVFSTLHTNDAATAIPRLIDLGAEPFLIASVLKASLAQRICRKICPTCKTEYTPSAEVIQSLQIVLGDLFPKKFAAGAPVVLYRGNGCIECGNTGYYGRIGVFELIPISATINKMIIQNATANEIETVAKKEGLITMKQDGYLKALEGITTIEEVLRVAELA